MAGMERAEFATRVEAPATVVVDRTVSWDATRYGAHADVGVAAPAQRWVFAEGATHSGFDLFYLLENPADTPADVADRLPAARRPAGDLTRSYTMRPHSRETVWVNHVDPAARRHRRVRPS